MTEVDYTKLSGPELLVELGNDASKWASAFIQHAELLLNTNTPDPFDLLRDHDWLTGWFANTIKHSVAVYKRRLTEEAARGRADIDGASIVMRIPVDALQEAADTQGDTTMISITDELMFAQYVVAELTAQYEDGTTPIQRVVGAACIEAFVQGADGVVGS